MRHYNIGDPVIILGELNNGQHAVVVETRYNANAEVEQTYFVRFSDGPRAGDIIEVSPRILMPG